MSKEKKNAYICDKLHATVTIDREDGVTPMFISCPVCNGQATSRMYRVDQTLEPTLEWFKPTLAELKKVYKGAILQAMEEHVKQGGLDLRKIEKVIF